MTEVYYTEDHEYVSIDEETGIATVGISDYAQQQLGEVVYVELPEVGLEVGVSDEVAVVESVKIASDVLAPVSGTITEVNDTLSDTPELINEDAAEKGWIFKMEVSDISELDDLKDEAEYKDNLG